MNRGFFFNRMDVWEEGMALVHRYPEHILREANT